ncbi:MAG TPA: MBL fold metallo-hydrolase [Terriglobales bacterium]|nr:MBL fold metallo-hydrolase [Terriglobales bacterium]
MKPLTLRHLCVVVFFALSCAVSAFAKPKALQIYFIDVEGGQSTLIVSPSGQSLLIDTGWPGFENRDANRIAAAAKRAGVKKLDYVLITHFHRDHVGGVVQLADKMPIDTLVDHGPNQEDSDEARQDYAAYEKLFPKHHHLVLKPGDGLPIKGLTVKALAAAGERIQSPLPGAGTANTFCGSEPDPQAYAGENPRSLGVLVTYGKFRFLDLGDLTKDKELGLVCPNNLIGTVDLFLVSHHGIAASNSKALVHSIHPRVAVINNGADKGGSAQAWQTVHDSPGIEDVWQLHYAVEGGPDHNVAEKYIANPDEKNDGGNYIEAVAESNGSFTVENSRNHEKKNYGK